MRLWFRVAASAIVWFVVALEYYLIAREPDVTLIEAAIRLLADFTILTNILVALAMTLLWLAPDSILGVFFSRPSVRTAIASYIIVSSTVYYLVLRGLWEPKRSGLSRRRDRALYRARALSLRLAAVRAEGHALHQVGAVVVALSFWLCRLFVAAWRGDRLLSLSFPRSHAARL